MKKQSLLILSSMLVFGMLASCGGDKTSSGENQNSKGDNPTSSEVVKSEVAEKYKVVVASVPDGISYTLDKTEAEEGEEVTFTLTSVAEGFTITSVTMNSKTIEGSNNVYKFNMPFGGARITVNYTISGDVTIQGEGFAVALDKEEDGIYRGSAKITSSAAEVGFNLMIQGTIQNYYRCYDYVNSYGHITWPGTGSDYGFAVASGCTYEFRYNPDAEVPFSIVRTSVDVLPSDATSLYRLFSGGAGAGMQDETCNPLNLKNATYAITDSSGDEFINYEYNYKKYEDNESLAIVEDLQNEETYYTYKHADLEKGVLSVVDTYPDSLGNNDYFKYTINPSGLDQYSFQQDIQKEEIFREDKWFDEPAWKTSERYAIRDVNWSAHAGNALEQELKWAYRVDSVNAVINAASYTKYDVVSTALDDGGFKVNLNSIIENNREESTSEIAQHEGEVYEIELTFNKEGNVTGMNYKYYDYPQAKWNFTTHEPSAKVGVTTKITYSAEYGDPNQGSPDFDESEYFIQSISDVTFYNETAGGDNCVGYGDYVALHTTEGETPSNLKKFDYLPTTALDAWQYEVTGDSKSLLDFTYTKAVAAGVGDTNINVTNHTSNSGITYHKDIKVSYSKSIREFYFTGTDRADECHIYSGDTQSFTVVATAVSGYNQSIVPVIYKPIAYVKVSEKDPISGDTTTKSVETDLIEFLQYDSTLTIKAKEGVTEKTTVYISMKSDFYYDQDRTTTLTCVIHPNTYDTDSIQNTTWKTKEGYWVDDSGNALKDYTQVEFGTDTGTITDVMYDTDGTVKFTDKYTFSFKQDTLGRIDATLTNADVKSYSLTSFSAYNWNLMLEPQNGQLGLALMADDGSDGYFKVFGDWTADGDEEYGYEYTCDTMEALDKVA